MPKDIRSFFKPAGSVSSTKSPSPKKDPFDEVSPKKVTTTKKETTPKSSERKRSSSSKRKEKEKAEKEKKKAEKEAEKIVIDDDSDADIIEDTPPRQEKRKSSKPPNKKAKKEEDDVDGEFECLKKRKTVVASSEDEEDIKRARKTRKKKASIEDSPVEKEKEKKTKKKKAMLIDSDSEEEVKEKKTRKPRKKNEEAPLIGVSDDDTPAVNPLKDAFSHAKPATSVDIPAKTKTPEKMKQVSVTDFFGGGQVQRTSRTPSVKRKSDVIDNDVIELHEDTEFEQTLAQLDLDNLEQPAKKAKTESLSEKIAAKMQAKVLVEETPVKDKNGNACDKPKPPSQTTKTTSPLATKLDKTPEKQIKQETVKKTPSTTTPGKPQAKTSPPTKVPPTTPSTTKAKNASTPASVKPASTPSSDAKRSGYHAFKSRSGPQALGSKEIPEGQPNCLEGLTFVITGVQESIDRDHLKSLLERYGAKVTTTVSKKTSYLITGREAGESKLNKAKQVGTKVIEEDEVFELIRTKPGKVSKYEIEAREAVEKERKEEEKRKAKEQKKSKTPPKEEPSTKLASSVPSTPKSSKFDSDSQTSQLTASPQANEGKPGEQLLWVDKYKPKSLKNVIGQQGEKSNAKKLLLWLRKWHSNISAGKKPSFGNKWNDDGSGYRAALLSGHPGVGKTTTAHLVCEEAGFTFIELNASDARSKKTLDNVVAQMLDNSNLDKMFAKKPETESKIPTNCLIMDEVDGMAGNEDRGGMAELIALIKKSHIPVICICNDRQGMKVRSLANHCFDLRFQKPRVEQIKSAMMSMAFKEGLKIPPPALNELIVASNQDVRQVIHNLSMWSASSKALTFEQTKKDAKDAEKDIKIGPFDVVRKVFASSESGTLNDKADLFFNDYSMGPLFVQENYIQVQPAGAKGDPIKHMLLLAQCADSIAEGDVISSAIRSSQSWSLLPLQAIASSVRPGELMRGYMGQMINFPSWLGKFSTRNKNKRLLEEINSHMHLKASTTKDALNMDYRTYLSDALYKPLLKEDGSGVQETMDILENYDLLKEDFESLMELSQWSNTKDGMQKVQSKTKAALTRKCNQSSRKLPYVTGSGVKVKKSSAAAELDEEGNVIEEAPAEDDGSDEDISKISSIKAVKPKAKAGEKAKGGDAGGKGKGKGKKTKSK